MRRKTADDGMAVVLAASVGVATERSTGSGTVVLHGKRNSYVLCCQHVVLDQKKVRAEYRSGKRLVTVSGVVERVDAEIDLALIRLSRRIDVPAISLAPEAPEVCDDVYVVGCPDGYFGVVGRCTLSSIENEKGCGYQLTGGVIMPGMSGGAVGNDSGELIGVLHAMGRSGNLPVWGLGFAVPLDVVKDFLGKGTKC